MAKKKLTLTVGITTCYGDESIIDTVKSIRASKGVDKFKFIVVADRVPIKPSIKKEFKKLHILLIENKKEAGQVKKQRQIVKLTKSDILILTQDDVLLDPRALKEVLKRFSESGDTTMISILNNPVNATSFFEGILNIGTRIANKMAMYWNRGDNYLSVIGRFMAFRSDMVKNKFRMLETVATSDAYYYFENKRLGGKYEYIPEVSVYFKNPQNMREHLRKSSRFQFSRDEMKNYFRDLEKEYKVPKIVVVRGLVAQFLENPIMTVLYLGIFGYTRILKMRPNIVLNPVWEVDKSTKKVIA